MLPPPPHLLRYAVGKNRRPPPFYTSCVPPAHIRAYLPTLCPGCFPPPKSCETTASPPCRLPTSLGPCYARTCLRAAQVLPTATNRRCTSSTSSGHRPGDPAYDAPPRLDPHCRLCCCDEDAGLAQMRTSWATSAKSVASPIRALAVGRMLVVVVKVQLLEEEHRVSSALRRPRPFWTRACSDDFGSLDVSPDCIRNHRAEKVAARL